MYIIRIVNFHTSKSLSYSLTSYKPSTYVFFSPFVCRNIPGSNLDTHMLWSNILCSPCVYGLRKCHICCLLFITLLVVPR